VRIQLFAQRHEAGAFVERDGIERGRQEQAGQAPLARHRFQLLQQLQGDAAALLARLDEGGIELAGIQVQHGVADDVPVFLRHDGATGLDQQRQRGGRRGGAPDVDHRGRVMAGATGAHRPGAQFPQCRQVGQGGRAAR